MMSSARKRYRCSWSAENIGHNEDLMTQILVKLPVNSIIRFRSVSKQWNSLLTSPQFIQRYDSSTHTRRRNPMLFYQRNFFFEKSLDSLYLLKGNNYYHNDLDIADFGYMQIPSEYSFGSVQSCNGLLLFQFLDKKGKEWCLYVCNPSTRKYCKLALPDYIATPKSASPKLTSLLAFDPCSSPYYKVIFFWKDENFSHDYQISIYSSETKTCGKLDCTFEDDDVFCSETFFDGSVFGLDNMVEPRFYFDINQESTRKVLPKLPYYKDIKKSYFGGDGGHMHFILGEKLGHVRDVYELKKDYSSWVAKYKIDIDVIGNEYIRGSNSSKEKRNYPYEILYVLENEEEATVVLHFDNKLMAYKCIEKTVKKLYDIPCHPGENEELYFCKAFHCIESLSDV